MRTQRFLRWIFLVALASCVLTSVTVSSSSDDEGSRSDDGNDSEDDVTVFTSVNFEQNIGDGSIWLVEFYAPWCGHCMNFAPTYSEIAKYFQSQPKFNVKVAKVDTTEQKALGQRFSVNSYPSFFIVHGSSVYEFEGSRSKTNLIKFATEGHKEQAAIPFLTSPMGPLGRLQGFLICAGVFIMGRFDWVQNATGFSPLLAGCLLCGAAVIGGMLSIFILVIALTPKDKVD